MVRELCHRASLTAFTALSSEMPETVLPIRQGNDFQYLEPSDLLLELPHLTWAGLFDAAPAATSWS